MATMKDLADELDTTVAEVREYLEQCGYTPAYGEDLWDEEVDLVRKHWDDPTPRYQWQVTEGGPSWDQDKRDEHDESL